MLEDIIKEIELEIMQNKEIGRKQVEGMCKAIKIIQPHLNEEPKCGDYSRRKWYQKGFEDGKKDITDSKKYYYTMSLIAEDVGNAEVFLTPEEAITVKKALDQMQENLVGSLWCGHCCIDIDDPHTQKIDFSNEEDEYEDEELEWIGE